jgi:hypothetical protein
VQVVPTSPVRAHETDFDPVQAALWKDLLAARAEVSRRRRAPGRQALSQSHALLLAALEAYIACLVERDRPVPYALRDEVRLWRCAIQGDRLPRAVVAPPRSPE